MLSWDSRSGNGALDRAKPLLGRLADELIVLPRRPVVPGPPYLVWCQASRIGDEGRVGARTVALGELHGTLARRGLSIPYGFATSADAFELFLDSPVPAAAWKELRGELSWRDFSLLRPGTLRAALRRLLRDPDATPGLSVRSEVSRSLVRATPVPAAVQDAIQVGYRKLREMRGRDVELAVRCSRAHEDGRSPFFGSPGEYAVGLRRFEDVVGAWRNCCASAFEEGALRAAVLEGTPLPGKGFGILIMTMVRSDVAVSGFVSTRDPRTGDPDTVHISTSLGVGEAVVPGAVEGDALILAKSAIRTGSPLDDLHARPRGGFLGADEVIRLAALALEVEDQYGCPVQLEWVEDGYTREFMVLQVNPLGPRPLAPGREPPPAPALEPW